MYGSEAPEADPGGPGGGSGGLGSGFTKALSVGVMVTWRLPTQWHLVSKRFIRNFRENTNFHHGGLPASYRKD